MEALFIVAVHHLRVPEPLGRGFKFAEGLFLANEKERVVDLVSPELKRAMGLLEYEDLLRHGHAIYYQGELTEEVTPEEAVKTFLDHVHTIFKSLWLVKDNSVNCELAFLEVSRSHPAVTWSSNFKARLYTTSRGSYSTSNFSLDELRQARAWFQGQLVPLVYPDYDSHNKSVGGIGSKLVPRLIRLLYFLTSARDAEDLGVKIASYITCLEILFSTSPSEIVHKISERVSYLLSPVPEDRIATFMFMKRAYDVRSRIVHGATLGVEKEKELPDICEKLDSLVRAAVTGFLVNPRYRRLAESSTTELEEYYVSIVLGIVQPESG